MEKIIYTTAMEAGQADLKFRNGIYYIYHNGELIMEIREEELWDIVKRKLRERNNLLNRRFWEAESAYLAGATWAAGANQG